MEADVRDKRPLLAVRDLCIGAAADGRAILDGVSFEVARGEILGLVGESGAGKSTAALAALGFIRHGCRHAAGSVSFDGADLLRMTEDERRRLRGARLTYVAQNAAASFNPAHRLMKQTIEAPVFHGVMEPSAARARAVRIFGELRLPEPGSLGRRFPHQLSGGQLQRAMTAMAMCPNPDLIVFDEPTTGLDVTTQVQVLAAIRKVVHDADAAGIYISHDLAVVAQMADRIAIMREGKIVEEGVTEDILRSPKHPYTRTLWSVRNLRIPDRSADAAVLSVRGLGAAYGTVHALEDVSIDVPRARTVAVVGESGSGKSTLARCITGLKRPARGTLSLDGRELPPSLGARSRDDCRKLQLIHQGATTSLNPRQTVSDIVGRPLQHFFGLGRAQRRRRVLDYLRQMGLAPELADRYPAQLSGGQQQRICLARALAAEPEVIVCDEITSALDQVVQGDILRLLQQVQEATGVAYLFITHDLSIVRAIADHVVVMHRGKVVDQGPKSDVFRPPHHPYTELLLSSVPDMDPGWLSRTLAARPAGSYL